MGKIVIVHSYKGGTGKTNISINLAAALANQDNKVCLMDLDFRAPSLATFFNVDEQTEWLNDYLNGICEIEAVLQDITYNINGRGELFVGLADPSTKAIREISSKDRKWEMRALGRLLSIRESLLEDKNFDYIILDTSPGVQYSSINAIVTADLAVVVSTFDKSDVTGTKRMINELYDLFEKKTNIVVNKVLYDISSQSEKMDLMNEITDIYGVPVLSMIPCFCDVARAEGAYIFTHKKPEHPFSKIMKEMANKIETDSV